MGQLVQIAGAVLILTAFAALQRGAMSLYVAFRVGRG